MTGNVGCPSVELYVRSLATETGPRREHVTEELTALAGRGAVEDSTVRVWGKEVPTTGTHPLTGRVAAFREWADAKGVELVGVEERSRGTLVDECRRIVTLPTMALAEYRDGDLAAVTPHRRPDGTICGVDDRLDAIADGSVPPVDASQADDVDSPLP